MKKYRLNIIPPNSIVIAKIGEALKKNHRKINTVPCIIDNNMQAFTTTENSKYCFYLLTSIDMAWFDNRGTVPSINNFKLMNSKMPKARTEEQKSIVDLLDWKIAEIDKIIDQKETLINELESYKKSLIYECVTGKRDVGA